MVKRIVRLRASMVTGVTVLSIAAGIALAPAASGQCTLQGTPNFFDPPPAHGWPMNGFESRSDDMDLYQTGGARRLAVRATYGYVVYDLSSPDRPTQLDFHDIHAVPGYERHGDGQSTVNAIGAAPDGSRMLVAYNDLHGTLVMTPNNNRFTFAGEFPPTWTSFGGGLAVDKLSSGRVMAYSLPRSGLHVADITVPITGAPATQTSSIDRELVDSTIAPIGIVHSLSVVVAGSTHYLLYGTGAKVVLIDVTNPGPSVGSFASGFQSRVFTAADFGFGAGTTISNISAAEHPGTNALYLFVEGSTTTGTPATQGAVLSRASVTGGLSIVGTYVPPTPFSGTGAQSFGVSRLLATDDDLIAFFWEKDAASRLKLFALAASDWTTDLAGNVILEPTAGQWEKAQAMTGYRQGSTVYLYVGNYSSAWAMKLSCVNSASPANADLNVERDPCPSGLTTCPLSSGATVFLGEKLKITTTVSPNPAQQPLTDWRFDYDYHASNANDAGATYPRLKAPDLFQSAGNSPPTTISLVGPCDPQGTAGVDPATGANCWASVLGNANFGGPDFTEPVPVALEGTSKSLALALEVQNAVNAAGTSGLKTFNVNWTVPRVKLKSSSILLGRTLEDASEGRPATTGFKWYFAALPDTVASDVNPLAPDPACTGAVCNHAFAAKGTYDYWVTVPFQNGYVSEDCGRPCTRSRGQVNVTDVVLAFTPPSSVSKSLATFTVTNQSELAPAVTACAGYEYSLCDRGGASGSCAAASWSPLSFSGSSASIPTPVPANYPAYYWLRIRYSYQTGAGCTVPTTATWLPNMVSGSPDAWPIVVSNVTPEIVLKFSTGTDVCSPGSSCPPFWLQHGDAILAYAYVSGAQDPSPPTITWDFGDGGTGSAQGAPHTYLNTTGTQISRTITLNGYGPTVTQTVNITPQPVVQNPPNVYNVSANPSNPTTGQNVSFSCSASQGSAAISSYAWTFGDGGTASGQSASHAYASNGTYTATCRVTDTAGLSGQRSTSVNVGGSGGTCTLSGFDWDLYDAASGSQIVPFGGYFDVASGQAVRFQGASASVPASGVTWTFGDGGTCGTNPCTHTFTNSTSGSKPFTVNLGYGSCSSSHVVYVTGSTPPPTQLDFTIVDATTQLALPKNQFNLPEATSGQRLKFKPTGYSGAVSWNFDDGETSTQTEPEHVFNTAFDHDYRVVLTNGSKTKQYFVAVLGSSGAPLTGDFTVRYADNTAVDKLAVQPGKAVRFTSLDSADSYLWDFGDGTPLGSGSPVEHTFTRGGTFAVKVTVGRAGVEPVTTPNPLVLTVLPPPEPLQWVLGGMAYSDGAAGTFWQSDLTLFNPSTSATMQVSLAFLDGRVDPDPNALTWLQIALAPQEAKTWTNVLSRLFYKERGNYGGILIRGDDVPVNPVITGRTYNSGSSGGTFGLSVPAVRVSGGVTPQGAAASNVLIGLRQNPAADGQPPSGSRTNLSLSNLKAEPAQAELRFFNAAGTEIGQPVQISLAPYRIAQLANVLSAAPPNGAGYTEPLDTYTIAVNLLSGSGVFPYATVIDNKSGDSIVVTSVRRPSFTYRLPGVIRAQGQGNTVWRSDVVLYNPGTASRRVNLTYSYVSQSGRRSTETDAFDVGPRQSLAWTDFVDFWLRLPAGDTGSYTDAFLDVTTNGGDTDPLLVLGKTYNDQPTGNVGLQVDAFTAESGVTATSSERRLVLTGLAADTSYRTNVVLLLATAETPASASVTIHVLDSFGREMKRLGETLDSFSRPIVQLNSDLLFGDIPGDRANLTVVVDGVTGSVPVGAYATVIDRLTGDATFVAGQPTL